jgi:hypothetical protein
LLDISLKAPDFLANVLNIGLTTPQKLAISLNTPLDRGVFSDDLAENSV